MEAFFVSLVPITLFLSIAGVLVLRPMTKRLGLLMEASARGRERSTEERGRYDQIRLLIDAQNMKIDALEQKLAFTESLLESRDARMLGVPVPTRRELA